MHHSREALEYNKSTQKTLVEALVKTCEEVQAIAKEKTTSVTAAYNLGGAALEIYYLQVENAGGDSAAKDEEKAAVRISTKF